MAGKKRKASTFTDEERADAVALLIMQGWPDKEGALTHVARHLNIWPNTLRRWATGESNPPPTKIVNEKKRDMGEAVRDMMWIILKQMGLTIEDASFQQLATAYGIMFDKYQLLTGGPTENINNRVLVLDFGDSPSPNGRAISD